MISPGRQALACGIAVLVTWGTLSAPATAQSATPNQQAKLAEANRLWSQANQLRDSGKLREAIPYAVAGTKLFRELFGDRHETSALALNNLGVLQSSAGDYETAKANLELALTIRRAVLNERDPMISASLSSLGYCLEHMGQVQEARRLYNEALALDRRYRGEKDRMTAMSLNRLGVNLMHEGDYAAALPLLEQALAVRRELFGDKNGETLTSLSNLGLLLRHMGEYTSARAYYERVLSLERAAYGDRHPELIGTLNNLGYLFLSMGDLDAAKRHYDLALAIQLENYGPKHEDTALLLNSIGRIYGDSGQHETARDLQQQALAIRRELLGVKHPAVAESLTSLAIAEQRLGELTTARSNLEQAIEIFQATYGPDNLNVWLAQGNLASVLADLREYDLAQAVYDEIIHKLQTTMGANHPHVASYLHNLSEMQAAQGKWQLSAQSIDQARHIVRRHVARVLPGLSEREQLSYLYVENQGALHAALSVGLARRDDPALTSLSGGWLLNGKGITQEVLAERARLARDSRDPQLAETVRELSEVRRQIATMTFAVADESHRDAQRQQLEQLQVREESLARRLILASNATASSDPWIELSTVREKIPVDAVLIEIARFSPFKAGELRNPWQPARYAAWLIPPAGQGDVRVIDLGEAAAVDEQISEVRRAIEAPDAIQNQGEIEAQRLALVELGKLSQRVLAPLLSEISQSTARLLISPDASLWLVPWSALPLADGRYAVEQFEIQLLVSGRKLVAPQATDARATKPVIMADPNFDLGRRESLAATQAVLRKQLEQTDQLAQRSIENSSKLPKVARLPGTAVEAQAISPKLTEYAGAESVLYADQYALEGVFKALVRPQVLVLSTHGFFLNDQQVENQADTASHEHDAKTRAGRALENPLVRCGLLLAGCNAREQLAAADDGVLTGLEIAGADLRGTELVVLSACETGLGKVQNGEGVAGLRHAFQIAGARAVVSTLWQVPDRDTSLLVANFFANLAGGQSKSAALRAAQLARIEARRERGGAAHPFFWAAFTITGQ